VANGTSCGSGVVCDNGTCVADCYIGGTFYASGTANPSNACQVCTPSSSTSAWSSQANGTTCNDNNACTQTDTCQNGACVGSNPVSCNSPPDKCHLTTGASCNPNTGACTYPAVSCITPPDGCHEATGVCDTSSGQCFYLNKPNGAACDDGKTCTQHDACWSGVCTGTVVCPAPDGCHNAGTCDASGNCSYTAKADGSSCNNCTTGTCTAGACSGGTVVANGTPCDDGNPYTPNDTCQGGTCVGGTPTECATPPDDCHTATGATADPVLGCVYPTLPDGTTCGGKCNTGGTCSSGVCVGATPKDCGAAASPCQVTYCDPLQGCVVDVYKFIGTPCDDGNPCTQGDTCNGWGFCVGVNTCGAQECVGLPDNTPCNDGNSCTVAATCQGGVCQRVGGGYLRSGETCDPGNPCVQNATCNASGTCVGTTAPDGTPCDDGNACTTGEKCTGGACGGGTAVSCAAPDACHVAGACDPATGCPVQPAGTPCSTGSTCLGNAACDGRGTCVGSPADFVPLPRGSWIYLSDYAGLAQGTDWTAAVNRALEDVTKSLWTSATTPVLYVDQPGVYDLSSTVVVRATQGLSIIGRDPATTTFRWTGPTNGDMFLFDSNNSLVMSRLTLDGQGQARIGIHQDQVYCWTWSSSIVCWAPQGLSVYQSEYSDLTIRGFQYGIVGGDWTYGDTDPATGTYPGIGFTAYPDVPQAGDRGSNNADTVIRRCTFDQISEHAVSITGANAIAWQIWDSRFTAVHHGVFGTGDSEFFIYNNYFEGTPSPLPPQPDATPRGPDSAIAVRQSSWYDVRGNVQKNGGVFLDGLGNNGNVSVIGNRIEAFKVPQGQNTAAISVLGFHLLLLDNVIGTSPGVPAVLVEARTTAGGNTYNGPSSTFVQNPYTYPYLPVVLDPDLGESFGQAAYLAATPFVPRIPVTPPVPATYVVDLCANPRIGSGQGFGAPPARTVLEFCSNAGSADIQAALNALAAAGATGSVIHLRAGIYNGITSTILVPGGLDVTIAGDGPQTDIQPIYAGTGPYATFVFDVQAPAKASIRNLMIYPPNGLPQTAPLTSGIRVQTTDGPNDRVYGEQTYLGYSGTTVELEGIDSAAVRIDQSDSGGLHYARVLGGGAAAADRSATRGLTIFGGAGGGYLDAVNLANYGKVVLEEMDFEGASQGSLLDGAGYLTQSGGRLATTSWDCNGNTWAFPALPNSVGTAQMRGAALYTNISLNSGLFFDAASSASFLALGAINDGRDLPACDSPLEPPAPSSSTSPFQCVGPTPVSSATPGEYVSLAATPSAGNQHMLLASWVTSTTAFLYCTEAGRGGTCDPSTSTCDAGSEAALAAQMLADLRAASVTPPLACGQMDVRLSRVFTSGDFGGGRPMPSGLRVEKKPDGTIQWANGFQSSAGVGATSALAVDGAGNAFVAGTAAGTIDFGGGVTLPAGAYLAKLDRLGNALWADSVAAAVITTDDAGNAYFGAGTMVGSYDPSGNPRWMVDLGAASVNAAVFRRTASTVVFGGAFSGTMLPPAGGIGPSIGNDGYVVELAALDGSFVSSTWLTDASGAADQTVAALGVDRRGNLLVGGSTGGTLAAGGTTYALGTSTEFLLDLGNGTAMGLGNAQHLVGLGVDWQGDVVVAGIAPSPFNLGSFSVTGAGGNIFVAKLSKELHAVGGVQTYAPIWAKLVGNGAGDVVGGVAVDPMGNVLLSGTQGTTPGLVKLDPYGNSLMKLSGGSAVVDPAWNKVFTGSAHAVEVAVAPTTFEVYLLLDNDSALDLGLGTISSGANGNQILAKFRP
jgi:hypothetical protein